MRLHHPTPRKVSYGLGGVPLGCEVDLTLVGRDTVSSLDHCWRLDGQSLVSVEAAF